MWILPKNLPISASAPVTEESTLHSTGFAEKGSEPSLLARSKPLRWKILLQKWKQGFFPRLRSGLTFAHSLGLTSGGLTYSAGVFHVSHSRRRESETPIAIQDTSSLPSSMASDMPSPDLFSWKMSKESSAPSSPETDGATPPEHPFCSMSSANWSAWVTARRQVYTARVKRERPTRGKEFLSWPTTNSRDWKDSVNSVPPSVGQTRGHSLGMAVAEKNWPTTAARDLAERGLANSAATSSTTNFSENTDARIAREVDWRTPTTEAMGTGAHMDSADLKLGHRVYNKNGKVMAIDLNRQIDIVQRLHGQAAPANPSTHGSRQGWWATPTNCDHKGASNPEACKKWEKRGQNLPEMVVGYWGTPAANDANKTPHCEVNSNQAGLAKSVGLELQRQWGTPSCMDTLPARSPEALARAKKKGGCKNLREEVVQWATPQASDHIEGRRTDLDSNQKCLGRDMKQWATPIMGDSHLASTPEVAQKRIEEGKVTLSRQMAAWATPQLQDGHNIAQDSTSHKTIPAQLTEMEATGKLNPRWVEMLQAVPLGWTSPDCPPSVIRNWPKFTSGWCAAPTAPTNSGSSETACASQPGRLPSEPSFQNSAKTIDT